MQPTLPKGFISIEEAVALIKSDTRSDAKVNTKWLVSHIDWIEEAHNFRIPLMKTVEGKAVEIGSRYVAITTSYERELLKKTIRDHYRDMVGREYEEQTTRAISTVSDEEQSGGAVRPRRSKSIAKEGAAISAQNITTNGAELN